MTAIDPKNQPMFGSVYRQGWENPDYQNDRMKILCEFNARIIDAYAAQVRELHRRGRKMWEGGRWQEEHARQLEQALQEAKKVADERAEWIKQLEEAKQYLTKQLEETTVCLENTRVYLTKQLENEKQANRDLRTHIDRIHNSRWWRLGRKLNLTGLDMANQ